MNIRLSSQQSPEPSLNAGSGFIYDDQGYIVASNHVVAGAAEAVVMFFNGDEVIAKVVGADRYTDLAVVRVSGLPEGTYPLQLGDSDQVQVGESVLAIGNVSGTGGSLNTGIIRAIGKPVSSTTAGLDRFQRFQTDMSTGLDLSGSPLVNLRGEVIGVNTYIPDQSDQATTSDPINEYVDLLNHIAFKDPGDKVLLTIIRDGQIKDITVILEPRPEDAGTGST